MADEGMDAHEAAAREAARRAGAIIRERFAGGARFDLKSNAIDLVTDVDRAAERAIVEVLSSAFPDHGILAEESGERSGSGDLWIVDPLDGTTNFAHSYPQLAISIALRRGGETVLGLVYDPVREETFVGRRRGGSFLNERPLTVSPAPTLSSALLATGFPYDRRRFAEYYLSFFQAFMMRTHGIRRAGSAALDLCWVAAGRVDGFWEWKLRAWDTSAGALVVEEAGGRVTDFEGNCFDPFGEQCLASNGLVHDEMLEVVSTLARQKPW